MPTDPTPAERVKLWRLYQRLAVAPQPPDACTLVDAIPALLAALDAAEEWCATKHVALQRLKKLYDEARVAAGDVGEGNWQTPGWLLEALSVCPGATGGGKE